MKVETGTITILRISDLLTSHRLDPVRVTLDDIGPGQGRITIECYGRAWASYWGAMGCSLAEFFISCNNDYLIGNLASGQDLWPTRFSGDALRKLCRSAIRGRRKGTREAMIEYDGRLTKEEASELMQEVHCMNVETVADCYHESETLNRIFGPDGVMTAVQATEPNPEYDYLSRICDAVREALVAVRDQKGPQ